MSVSGVLSLCILILVGAQNQYRFEVLWLQVCNLHLAIYDYVT